jgi:site-specific DNA recombinase
MGYNGIAKYLNRQGIVKMPRKNGTLKNWSAKMVKDVIDNPVYKGTIAYGRRIREKVKGTRADYKQVRNKEPILVHNAHKGIISVEDWEKAKEKRELTGFKSPSNVGRDRVHLLAGILRCPECGGPMYTNKTNAKRKNSAVEEVFYYVCAKNKSELGTSCSYSTSYRKDDIEPIVLNEIRNLVRNPLFAEHIKSKIGKEVDTTEIDKELSEYKKSLKLCESAKDGLEQDIDTMPLDEPHRERKLKDKNKRLNK